MKGREGIPAENSYRKDAGWEKILLHSKKKKEGFAAVKDGRSAERESRSASLVLSGNQEVTECVTIHRRLHVRGLCKNG